MPWDVLDAEAEIIAIHVALLPTSPQGDIPCYGDWTDPDTGEPGPIHFTHCRLYHIGLLANPAASVEELDEYTPDTNAFCGGQAFLADGRLLAAGGTVGWPAHDRCFACRAL